MKFITLNRLSMEAVLRASLACLAPSVPFLIVRHYNSLNTGQVNIDFLFAYLVYLVAGQFIGVTFFVLVCLTEVLRIFDRVYFFSDQDLLTASGFILQVQPRIVIVTGLIVIGGISLLAYMWIRILPDRKKHRWSVLAIPVVLLFGLLFMIDTVRGFNPILKGTNARIGTHALEETLYSFTRAILWDAKMKNVTIVHTPAATDKFRNILSTGADPGTNLVVVLVESMGQLKNSSYADQEFALFDDPVLLSHYSIKEGTVPFNGGTVSGEIRELCRLRVGLRVDAALAASPNCLPDQLNARGYKTESIHGYTGKMFHRNDWHKQIGFQRSYFLEDMKSLPGYHMCYGAFGGICDADVAHHIDEELASISGTNRRVFIHWITLNSHLPISSGPAPPGPCFPGYASDVCGQLGYVAEALRSTKAIAEDIRIPATTFVIVGDHAPPYIERAKRELFVSGSVPFIVLTPKREVVAGSSSSR